MSQVITSNAVEATESTFSPGDYFLGLAQRAIASGHDTRIALPGAGDEVLLYPARQMYSANLSDPEGFFQEAAGKFKVTSLGASAEPREPRHLAELLWMAGFHASRGRMTEGTSMFDVVEFHHWPNLTKVPHTANTARICALLTRHPTTIMLAHRLLGIKKDEVYRVYSAAHAAGIANIIHQNPEATAAAAPEVEEKTDARGLFRSLFSKISGL